MLKHSPLNLHQEGIIVEGILVQKDTCYVADDFEHEAHQHANTKPPCLSPDTEPKLRDDQDTKEDRKEEVATKMWTVEKVGLRQAAGIERASLLDGGIAVGEWVNPHLA